jgi:hypothetical protein
MLHDGVFSKIGGEKRTKIEVKAKQSLHGFRFGDTRKSSLLEPTTGNTLRSARRHKMIHRSQELALEVVCDELLERGNELRLAGD